jgi:stage IV sporulation protein B
MTTIEGNEVEEFDIEIQKVMRQRSSESKSMIIKVTDKKLIEKTGGIVQGMSGSPIIQDGKLIGCVTHVLVNDPTRGFGISIEWMLKEADIDFKSRLKRASGE